MDMQMQLQEIERKLDIMMDMLSTLVEQTQIASSGSDVLDKMTTKMHVAAQMVLAGKSNREIGKTLGVNENGAKVHVRNVAKKLGVNSRGQIVGKLLPIFQAVDPERYEAASGGLPVDWAKHPDSGTESDPYRGLYRDD